MKTLLLILIFTTCPVMWVLFFARGLQHGFDDTADVFERFAENLLAPSNG